MSSSRTGVVCAAFLLFFSGAAARAQEKSPQAESRPKVYDEKADAKADVAAAVARAAADNQRVLVVFGGNWCVWCIRLHDVFKKNAEISREILFEYEVVKVDIGNWDKHTDLIASYGAADNIKKQGVPYLVVLDGAGKVLKLQDTGSLEAPKSDHHDPAKVMAFLKAHRASPLDAEAVLKAAVARAEKEQKLVFLHFGAPWCGYCGMLERFLARADIAPILGADYVDVKIDVDRMTNGPAVIKRYRQVEKGGIPWFIFMSPKGEVLATSDAKDGNIGHPIKPDEVAHFMGMLKKTKQRITDAQLATIEAVLAKQEK